MLHVLEEKVEDISFTVDKQVGEHFGFGGGLCNQRLQYLVEISAKNGFNSILVKEVK